MDLSLILLIIYALTLLIYVAILIKQSINFRNKFGYLCECSGLGEQKNEGHKVYNAGYLIWGLLSIGFSYTLSQYLQQDIFAAISQILLYLSSISLCFIAIFPRDTHFKTHTVFSITLFVGIIGFMLTLIYPFLHSKFISPYLVTLNIWVAVTLMYYFYLKITDFRKYGRSNDRERYVSIYEWVPFLSGFLWSFLVTISLLLEFI